MQEIDAANAAEYLLRAGLIEPGRPAGIRTLDGGVSNMVLLVEPASGAAKFVVKQARHQLRTRQEWFSRLERIWREIDVLEICAELTGRAAAQACDACAGQQLPPIGVPQILFVDRDNYLFAMTAAEGSEVWKAQLLAGQIDPTIAAASAHLLATLHGLSWRDAALAERLGDKSLFDELRIDPYYRTLAGVHPQLRIPLAQLIQSVSDARLSLVHADFSPKNLLVGPAGLMMVDFETGHFGEPAFDLGFFLSHLVLKAFYHAPRHEPLLQLADVFWRSYERHMQARIEPGELADLERRAILNLAGCALARIDGKSPVDYLTEARRADAVRQMCIALLREPPTDWQSAVEGFREGLEKLSA